MTEKIVRFFFFCFALLTISCHVFATSLNTQLNNIEKTYQNTKTLQAEFTQSTYVPLLEKTIARPGRIFYQRGGKLRIEYAGSQMTHYISNGDTLWIIEPKTKKQAVVSLKDSGLPDEALRFLTELGNLRTYFQVSPKNETDLKLKPKHGSTYKSLTASFGKDYYLKTLMIHTKSGSNSEYQFTNLKTGMEFPPTLFQIPKVDSPM